jgi:hypothetical protein
LAPALLLTLLLTGAAALPDEPKPAPNAQQQKKPEPSEKPKLSAEDEALVKDLAVVENVELLEHLDLFEGKEEVRAAKDQAQRQQ